MILRNLNKIFIIVLLLIISLNLFAEDKVILKVFELPDPKRTDAFAKADMAVIKAFKEKYPHIELRSFSGISIEGMDMDSKPLMAIAGGVSPDILYINFRQSDTYIQNNFLYPLDEFIESEGDNILINRVADPVWPVINRQKTGDNKKRIWMLPYETLVRVMIYRKDLFNRVGIDPDDPPDDWEELYDYAKRMTIPSEGIYGLYLASGPQAAYDWITYLWSAGGDAVLQNKNNGNWYASFNSDAGVDAMEMYLHLITTNWLDSEGKKQRGFVLREGDYGRLFSEGKIGMMMTYMNDKTLGGEHDPKLYGVAPPPKGPTVILGSE
ncbi:MAG: extracellular solute-binding protein, partial [Flavobacteriaceae bacterium]|nr:extracellular solute-binding protein [Flavobacteriaceae bacterium]